MLRERGKMNKNNNATEEDTFHKKTTCMLFICNSLKCEVGHFQLKIVCVESACGTSLLLVDI